MNSQLLKCLLLMLVTALLTYFITCYFCKKNLVDVPGGTRDLTTICMNYDTITPPTLTGQMVKSMVVQYDQAQLNNIQTAASNAVPKDAKSIWFDLETLKQFLYHIEHNAARNHQESVNKKLGVRIYYAAYPDNAKMREMAASQTDPNFSYNPDYEKLHTLVMIPTISGTGGSHYDFNPLDVNSYNGFTNMKKVDPTFTFDSDTYTTLTLGTSSDTTTASGASISGSSPINARNHGSLYPPTGTASCLAF